MNGSQLRESMSMGTLKRRDLKPAKVISDERFLAGAMASATKARKHLERSQRTEQTLHELARQSRWQGSSAASPKG